MKQFCDVIHIGNNHLQYSTISVHLKMKKISIRGLQSMNYIFIPHTVLSVSVYYHNCFT